MSFLSHYVPVKLKAMVESLNEAIVKFDPEGATEAAIAEIETKFDVLNGSFSTAKQTWKRENDQYAAIVDLYNKRLAAAELLKSDPTKADALVKLVDMLEAMQPDIDREKQDALEAKADMEQLEQLVTQYAVKLKSARTTVERAKAAMARATVQKERAKESAEIAAMAAGLSQKTTGLSSALDTMNDLASKALAEADAANNKARLLQPTVLEDDPDIKAAMASVSGISNQQTIEERLSALKKPVSGSII